MNETQNVNPKIPNWKLYENPFCKKIPKIIDLLQIYIRISLPMEKLRVSPGKLAGKG